MVAEKLKTAADQVAEEGWKWIEVAVSFPYGHDHGLRELAGATVDLTDEERATREALREEYDRIEAEYSEADAARRDRSTSRRDRTGPGGLREPPGQLRSADIAIAGAFVSLDADGSLSIDRGYVRAEDEPQAEPDGEASGRRPARYADRPARSSPSAASLPSPRTMRKTASSRCPSVSSSS
jgi:ParB family chromosome partitioning protein